eukprot:IDg20890t1
MAIKNTVDGLDLNSKTTDHQICEGCVIGKLPRTKVPSSSSSRSTGLLDLIHTDVAEFPERTKGGSKYFVSFIDDMSKMVSVYPIHSKSNCFDRFLKYRSHVETQKGRKIKALRSDGGG